MKISKLVKSELFAMSQDPFKFTSRAILKTLEKYYHPVDVCKILGIGKTSYYTFKRTGKSKYVERAILNFYIGLESEENE